MAETDNKPQRIKVLLTIVERSAAPQVVAVGRQHDTEFHLLCRAHGTADSELMDLLGLGTKERAVVISVVREEKVPELLEAFRQQLHMDRSGAGIAFTIPISSVGGAKTLAMLAGSVAAP